VVSTNVFEHLRGTEQVVAKALDRLRPGGAGLLVFQEDSGLGHTLAMKTSYRWFQARYLPEAE
jgi:2-polyprenyl-3-methyl-5-hydroxy-6-metoxy-1,4-benzoquinol methylase